MEYVIIGACIVVAIAGGIVLYVKNKRTKNELGNTAGGIVFHTPK